MVMANGEALEKADGNALWAKTNLKIEVSSRRAEPTNAGRCPPTEMSPAGASQSELASRAFVDFAILNLGDGGGVKHYSNSKGNSSSKREDSCPAPMSVLPFSIDPRRSGGSLAATWRRWEFPGDGDLNGESEIGEGDAEKDRMLLELEMECLQAYRRKVDDAINTRALLRQSLATKEAELRD
ncbi:65-kDa microtubule-associated protein 7 [Platanthera guangdongensis]|uniref:65-kDa microtubule-associated protein 7 n=1 Tax=Platanthera guangdongensis TaxID=2320717 RepID=A0ABR2N1F9_9ASPA